MNLGEKFQLSPAHLEVLISTDFGQERKRVGRSFERGPAMTSFDSRQTPMWQSNFEQAS